jgi:hypothetical protein
MAFFQNLFDQEYQGYMLLADRKLIPTFKVAPNKNLQSKQVAWNAGPYDLSGGTSGSSSSSSSASGGGLLEFNFAWDKEFRNWARVSIDVAGSNPSATTAAEVVNALNSNATFFSVYTASVVPVPGGDSVLISRNHNKQNVRFYFGNSGAETALGFNKKAGVSELPVYFDRHSVENVRDFDDSVGILVRLDETNPVDQAVIENAGFDPAAMQADWQLMRGRASGLFTFQKLTVDGSDRITQIIEYPAGAVPGDLARKIQYTYAGGNSNPSKVTEIPHVLESADLVTP